MATVKTKPGNEDVKQYLAAIESDKKRDDCVKLLELFTEITALSPQMWAGSMIGFGSYHYKYESGREGDSFTTGFSPRKQNIVVYIMNGFSQYSELLEKLGKYKMGKSCLYLTQLEKIDIDVLRELISLSFEYMQNKYNG